MNFKLHSVLRGEKGQAGRQKQYKQNPTRQIYQGSFDGLGTATNGKNNETQVPFDAVYYLYTTKNEQGFTFSLQLASSHCKKAAKM